MRTGQELTTAETVIAAQLRSRLGSLPLGARLRIELAQMINDRTGRPLPGPHIAGWVERPTPGGMRVRLLVSTEAGRTAAALLEEELLDVVLSRDYPPSVRLM
jgi:hypothetical protein